MQRRYLCRSIRLNAMIRPIDEICNLGPPGRRETLEPAAWERFVAVTPRYLRVHQSHPRLSMDSNSQRREENDGTCLPVPLHSMTDCRTEWA
eukprot:scaffold207397_cov52-Cyclotella_meneghiniana.AAC.2